MRITIILTIALLSFTLCTGQNAMSYYEKGLQEYSSAEFEKAKRDFTKAIDLNPNFADAYTARGNARQRAFNLDFKGALSDYSKAIQLDPKQLIAYVNRGLLKSNSKEHAGAIEDYNKAIEIDGNYAKAYRFRGDSKKAMGDESGALADYEIATELELTANAKTTNTKPTSVPEPQKVDQSILEGAILEKDSKKLVVDMTAFLAVEKEINFAGLQLRNARRTFGFGFFLSLLGGALATGGYFAEDPKVKTGLIVAGGVTSLVGSVVVITAVIPIGGAGKILQGIRFPNTLPVKVE